MMGSDNAGRAGGSRQSAQRVRPTVAFVGTSGHLPYTVGRYNAVQRDGRFEVVSINVATHASRRAWERGTSRAYVEYGPLASRPMLAVPKVWKLLRRIQPAVVVVHGYSDAAMISALLWCRANKVVPILCSDSTFEDKRRSLLKEMVKGLIVRQYAHAIVAGRRSRDYLVRLGFPQTRTWIVMPVVDNEFIWREACAVRSQAAEMRNLLRLPDRYFLFVGRFVREKNLAGLLRAYAKYLGFHRGGAWDLVLVGDGPERERVEVLIQRLGLARKVRTTGFVQPDELPPYYALASCLVLPSTSETWGLVVNEAMACGLPVLVSERCGCAPELVLPGLNGYTFDPMDHGRLAELMLRMSTAGDSVIEAMSGSSRQLIAKHRFESWGREVAACVQRALGTSWFGSSSGLRLCAAPSKPWACAAE